MVRQFIDEGFGLIQSCLSERFPGSAKSGGVLENCASPGWLLGWEARVWPPSGWGAQSFSAGEGKSHRKNPARRMAKLNVRDKISAWAGKKGCEMGQLGLGL